MFIMLQNTVADYMESSIRSSVENLSEKIEYLEKLERNKTQWADALKNQNGSDCEHCEYYVNDGYCGVWEGMTSLCLNIGSYENCATYRRLTEKGMKKDRIGNVVKNNSHLGKPDIYIYAFKCSDCGAIFTLEFDDPIEKTNMETYCGRCPVCNNYHSWPNYRIGLIRYKFIRYWRGQREKFYKLKMRFGGTK